MPHMMFSVTHKPVLFSMKLAVESLSCWNGRPSRQQDIQNCQGNITKYKEILDQYLATTTQVSDPNAVIECLVDNGSQWSKYHLLTPGSLINELKACFHVNMVIGVTEGCPKTTFIFLYGMKNLSYYTTTKEIPEQMIRLVWHLHFVVLSFEN